MSDTSFASAIQNEIASLQKELEGDPRFTKLQRLMGLLDLYLEDERSVKDSTKSLSSSKRKPSEQNQAILTAVADFVMGKTTPTPTAVIYDFLDMTGIEVHGNNPKNTLSAMLSHADEFKSHGRSGWTLVEQPENTETADAKPGEASSAASSEPRLTSGGTHRGPVNPWPGGGT